MGVRGAGYSVVPDGVIRCVTAKGPVVSVTDTETSISTLVTQCTVRNRTMVVATRSFKELSYLRGFVRGCGNRNGVYFRVIDNFLGSCKVRTISRGCLSSLQNTKVHIYT